MVRLEIVEVTQISKLVKTFYLPRIVFDLKLIPYGTWSNHRSSSSFLFSFFIVILYVLYLDILDLII